MRPTRTEGQSEFVLWVWKSVRTARGDQFKDYEVKLGVSSVAAGVMAAFFTEHCIARMLKGSIRNSSTLEHQKLAVGQLTGCTREEHGQN